jgi:hypothetical protein
MNTAAKADGKENSIADLERTKQTIIASYTRDHGEPKAALMQRLVGGWIGKIARASLRLRGDRIQLEVLADHRLSKGCAKRMYLENGARVLCRRGKVYYAG